MSFLSIPPPSPTPPRRCHYGVVNVSPLDYFGTALVSRLGTFSSSSPHNRGEGFLLISYAPVLSAQSLKLRARLSFNEINGWASKLNAIKPLQPTSPRSCGGGMGWQEREKSELLESHFNFRVPLGLRREVDRADASLSHYWGEKITRGGGGEHEVFRTHFLPF